MKLRILATLLLAAIISNISIVIAAPENVAGNINETIAPLGTVNKVPMDLTSWRETIQRNEKPETISDIVAFTLFFRFIAGNQDAEAKKRIRSY